MTILYDLIFLIFSLLYLPIFLLRRKMHAGFAMRLGFLPKNISFCDPIWIHAVSVGEAMAVRHLVESLREKIANQQFVISTVTPTGNRIARSIARNNDVVIYLPLDFSFIVRPVIKAIKPKLFVLTETELWPNLLTCLAAHDVPVVVVNGRISDRSLKGYALARPLLKGLLAAISLFCVQTDKDKERLVHLGVAPDKVRVTGNMKFDIKIRDYDELRKDYTDYRMKLGLGVKEKLWVAASTHPGEEEMVLDAYQVLQQQSPDFKLLIAPRHPERAPQIESRINKSDHLKAVLISQLSRQANPRPFAADTTGRLPVFVLDTIGQLMYFYALSDIVFVGGSLVKKGGHNILEPASLGKPIVFGSHMFNFRDITELFLAKGAGIMVRDEAELKDTVQMLLGDQNRTAALGRSSRDVILANQGATQRNSDVIREMLRRP